MNSCWMPKAAPLSKPTLEDPSEIVDPRKFCCCWIRLAFVPVIRELTNCSVSQRTVSMRSRFSSRIEYASLNWSPKWLCLNCSRTWNSEYHERQCSRKSLKYLEHNHFKKWPKSFKNSFNETIITYQKSSHKVSENVENLQNCSRTWNNEYHKGKHKKLLPSCY